MYVRVVWPVGSSLAVLFSHSIGAGSSQCARKSHHRKRQEEGLVIWLSLSNSRKIGWSSGLRGRQQGPTSETSAVSQVGCA